MSVSGNFFERNPQLLANRIAAILPEVVPVSVSTSPTGVSTMTWGPVGAMQMGSPLPFAMPYLFRSGYNAISMQDSSSFTPPKEPLAYDESNSTLSASTFRFGEIVQRVNSQLEDAGATSDLISRRKLIEDFLRVIPFRPDAYHMLYQGLLLAHGWNPAARQRAYSPLERSAAMFADARQDCLAAFTYEFLSDLARFDIDALEEDTLDNKAFALVAALEKNEIKFRSSAARSLANSFENNDDNRNRESKKTRAYRNLYNRWAANEKSSLVGPLFILEQVHTIEKDFRSAGDDLMRFAYFRTFASSTDIPIILNNLTGALGAYKSAGIGGEQIEKLHALIAELAPSQASDNSSGGF